MTQRSEAIFEDGLLRPLEPLALHDRQPVPLTISDVPAQAVVSGPVPELEWLSRHGEEYAGQWVALEGEELLSYGSDARAVRDEARAKGVERPLMVHIRDEPNMPSAFWI